MRWTGAICVALFVLLTILVQAGLWQGFDASVAIGVHTVNVPLFENLSVVAATLFASEASIVYAAVASLLLWRAGAGRFSIAPFAFIVLTGIEAALKLTIDQHSVPGDLQRRAAYPFTIVNLPGTFPSGHAVRIAFLCVFAAVLLAGSGRRGAIVAAVALALVSVPLALTRVYMGYHWTSDVVAGLLLGWGTALLVAPPVSARLMRRARQASRP